MALIPKDTPIPKELIEGVIEGKVTAARFFETIPFDPIPGGFLSYPKPKDVDNDERDNEGSPAHDGAESP